MTMKFRSGPNKTTRAIFARFFAVLTILGLAFSSLPIRNALAVGVLSTPRDYLSRQQADVASGITHQVFFTTVSSVTGGASAKITLQFPDADDGKWCRTAGTDLVVTGIANPTGATESATTLPGGSVTASCTQGSGGSSFDKIIVANFTTLSATTKYGVQIAQAGSPTALLGTAASAGNDIQVLVTTTNNSSVDIDSGTLAMSLITNDQVAVSATVNPTLTVVLSANTASLGTLDTGHINQAGITSQVTTNGANGYASLVNYNATLTSGSNTIQDVPGSTLAIGNEGYGAASSQSGNTIAQWNPTACSTTTSTTNLTALSTSFKSFASASAPVSAQTTTLCFGAGVSGTTKAGSYTSTSTLVTTGKF